MAEGLAQELMQAHQGKGAAVAKREAVHKMAVANQVLPTLDVYHHHVTTLLENT